MFSRLLFSILLCFLAISVSVNAGSRGLSIAFLDATVGEPKKEGKRLAELLEADMRTVFVANYTCFPWSDPEVELTVLKKQEMACAFDRLLNGGKVMAIRKILAQKQVQDGLIVYAYDWAHGCARLKLFSADGVERMLIRVPLGQTGSQMQYSVLQHTRHGVLTALGSAVEWNP